MIIVEIGSVGVERISFASASDEEEARCMKIYPIVKKELRRIDKTLLDRSKKLLKMFGLDGEEVQS